MQAVISYSSPYGVLIVGGVGSVAGGRGLLVAIFRVECQVLVCLAVIDEYKLVCL